MKKILKYGQQIINWHIEHSSLVLNYLQDGLEYKRITCLLENVEVSIPLELADLYHWKNGTLAEEGVLLENLHFFPGFYFLSLEESISYHINFKNDYRWKKDWFPVFANGGGDFFVIDCDKKLDYPIVGFMLGQGEHEIEYLNIEKMIETIASCYKFGAYFYDSNEDLEIDDEKEAQIANKLNPNLSRWLNELPPMS